jgi:hypothetical protein
VVIWWRETDEMHVVPIALLQENSAADLAPTAVADQLSQRSRRIPVGQHSQAMGVAC